MGKALDLAKVLSTPDGDASRVEGGEVSSIRGPLGNGISPTSSVKKNLWFASIEDDLDVVPRSVLVDPDVDNTVLVITLGFHEMIPQVSGILIRLRLGSIPLVRNTFIPGGA